jgi:hypothetical protein
MTLLFNKDKINNILFFNPKIIKDNSYKYSKYNVLYNDKPNDFVILPSQDITEREKLSEFKKFRDNLYKGIRNSGRFCDGLQAGFVKDSLKDSDAILKVESSQTRSKKINGFATLKFFKGSKSLYIDVICTNSEIKGTGTYMINILNKICKEISVDNIKLSATETAVPFYLKTEFQCNPLCKMIKEVKGGYKTKKNRVKSHNKTSRNSVKISQ